MSLPLDKGWSMASFIQAGSILTGTKLQAAWKWLEIMSAGKWRIVWGPMFQSARKLKLAERSEGKREILMSDEFSVIILLLWIAF